MRLKALLSNHVDWNRNTIQLLHVGVVLGLLTGVPSAYALLTNGDFEADLAGWTSEGSVVVSDGMAVLTESSEAPVLFQAVAVSGYVYELRFDVYLGGLSSAVGTGSLDTAQVLVYVGMDAAGLTPDSAADESILIEADADGLLTTAPNAQVVPNAALGEGWYSAVVEVTSDFAAIAPATMLVDSNAVADSSIAIDNVSLVALDRGRFANISNRGGVGTGANIMIPGFVIEGPTNKSLVIRGAGPTLGELGVQGTIPDPQLTLYYRVPTPPGSDPVPDEVKGANDNWEEAPDVDALKAAMAQVGAFSFSDGSADAALLATDLLPGAYTVQVSGVADVTGVGLAEIYDLGSSADGPTELVNISNRGFIGTGSEVQIPGFVIGGNRGRVVLVRAVGPTLGDFGVPDTIEDPLLELYDQSKVGEPPLFTNDNWGDAINATEVEATAARVGAFPLGTGSKDASILASLPPGSYTAVATGVDDATGVALVEVYVVTSNQRPTAFGNALVVTSDVPNVLPLDEVLGDDTDPENDVLSVGFFTQPDEGTITMNDGGELVYTSPAGFFGRTAFSYRASDGEYESVPATIRLQVHLAGTFVWEGGSSDDFSDPANWVGGVAPGADDPVWIAPEGGGTVVVDADAEVGSVWIGDSDSAVTLELNGKALTVAGGLKVQPGSSFELSGNGTLDTTQDAVIEGELKAHGATMKGEGTTVLAEGSTALILGAILSDGRDLINHGTLLQQGSLGVDGPDATSTITNAPDGQWTADMAFANNIASPRTSTTAVAFVNEGTLTKVNSAAILMGVYSGGSFSLSNTGTIDVAGGKLVVNGGVNELGGTVNTSAGAFLDLQLGTTTIVEGTEFTGEGGLWVNSTTATLAGSLEIPGLVVTNATLVVDHDLSVGRLTQEASVISGTGDVTITDTFDFSGGQHAGTGTTLIADGASATLSRTLKLSEGRNVTNYGTVTQTGWSGIVSSIPSGVSTITNASGAHWVVDMLGGATVAANSRSDQTLDFINEGTLTKRGAVLNYLCNNQGNSRLTSTGVIEVEEGTLGLQARTYPEVSGRLSTSSGAVLQFGFGLVTLSAGTEISGEGLLQVSSATVTLMDSYDLAEVEITSGILETNAALTIGNLTQSLGTITGAADLTVTGMLDWDRGEMAGAGTTIIDQGATAVLDANIVNLEGGRNFLNKGTLTQIGQASIAIAVPSTTSTITNTSGAQWTATMDNGIGIAYSSSGTSTLTFINAGTLTKHGAETRLGHSSGKLNLTNTGTIEVVAGTLVVEGNGTSLLDAAGTVRLTTDGTTTPLDWNGALTIDGTLEVILADGYTPASSATIRLIDFSSKTGAFSTITPPQGRTLTETYVADGMNVTFN